MKSLTAKFLSSVILLILSLSCVESFDIPDDVDQSVLNSTLIVEATLTNELKRQKVMLSRPSNFAIVNQEDSIYDPNVALRPIPPTVVHENNADVSVIDDRGNEYPFDQTEPGTYTSQEAFGAEQGVGYELRITTSDGTVYTSTPESFRKVSRINEVYAERDFNNLGTEGVYIYVDGQGLDNESDYYRYTYEETYKIVAPEWRKEDFLLSNYDPCALPVPTYNLEIVDRENELGKVCYGRGSSSSIIQTSTLGFEENVVKRFPVRFLDRSNYIISHRYSILVKQYVQSADAYNFYNTLNSFSSSESVFSSVQPGVLEGNLNALDDDSKTVLGYFEVVPVTEKRLFFNYGDLFPDEALPDYVVGCFPRSSRESHVSYCYSGPPVIDPCPASIVELVNIDLIAYYGVNEEGEAAVGICPGPYTYTSRSCGDCTVLGASEVPEFWTE